MKKIILGIETSCDETSAAVMQEGVLLSNIISSQHIHEQFGGVVPELASRAHQKVILSVIKEALREAHVSKEELSAVAAAIGPGLMGSLLVGVNLGKAFAYGLNVPFIGVNHMEAHIYSNFIEKPVPQFPFLNLTVSGGHTQLVKVADKLTYELLGETKDDAVGEAFDKVGKMLGLPYPAGPHIDRLALTGNPNAIQFTKPYSVSENYDFSFSGIKTSVLYYLRDHGLREKNRQVPIEPSLLADICASFQSSVIRVLVRQTLRAAADSNVREIAISGGVSANSQLRKDMKEQCDRFGYSLFIPRIEYCTDNAAMIAEVGYRKLLKGLFSDYNETATANLALVS
jgi:N6-L-threonylcarbamoyladenine synthase